MPSPLVNALVNMQEDEAVKLVHQAIDKGQDPSGILDSCQEAMTIDRKSTRLNSSHSAKSRMPSSA